MARVIKAPNVALQGGYNIIDRDITLQEAENRARSIMADARNQEKSILDTATAQADEIIANAQAEGEQTRKETENLISGIVANAEEEGKQRGIQQGLIEVREQTDRILNDLAAMAAEANRQLQELFNDQETEMRKFVADVVSRVVQEKVEEDDEIVLRTIKKCLEGASDRQRIRILISAADEEAVREHCDDFRRAFDDVDEISIDTDPRVSRGGAMVETGYGSIDGRIDRQLNIVEETLTED